MEKPVQIKSVDQLYNIVEASENAREFFILLNGGLRSWKTIYLDDCLMNEDDETSAIVVVNQIDDSEDVLTKEHIKHNIKTNIGLAITNGAFYLYDDNENEDHSDEQYY